MPKPLGNGARTAVCPAGCLSGLGHMRHTQFAAPAVTQTIIRHRVQARS